MNQHQLDDKMTYKKIAYDEKRKMFAVHLEAE